MVSCRRSLWDGVGGSACEPRSLKGTKKGLQRSAGGLICGVGAAWYNALVRDGSAHARWVPQESQAATCCVLQVLDDSTCKATRALVDDKVLEWKERGVNCECIRRTNRQGYKAGALKEVRRLSCGARVSSRGCCAFSGQSAMGLASCKAWGFPEAA